MDNIDSYTKLIYLTKFPRRNMKCNIKCCLQKIKEDKKNKKVVYSSVNILNENKYFLAFGHTSLWQGRCRWFESS